MKSHQLIIIAITLIVAFVSLQQTLQQEETITTYREDKSFPTDNINIIEELHSGNFRKKFKSVDHIFVFYYSPFCKYSINLASEYIKTAYFFKSFPYSKDILLGKFNVNSDKETAEELKVEGTPSFRYYYKGKLIEEYEGLRTSVGVFNFILHSLKIYSTEIEGVSQLTAFKDFTNANLVYFINDINTSNLEAYKNSIKNINDEVLFAHIYLKNSDNKDIVDKFSEYVDGNSNTIVLFIDHEYKSKLIVDNSEEAPFSSLSDFISYNTYDYILTFNEQTSKLVFSQAKPALFFYSSPKDYQKYYDFIKNELPSSVREKIIIFLLGKEGNDQIEGRLFSLISANYKDFPSVKIHRRVDSLMSNTMKGDITVENVKQFVDNYIKNGFIKEEKEEDNKRYRDDL